MASSVQTPAAAAGRVASTGSRRPLWPHAVLLLVVLTALIPVIGTRGQFHDDEGAALLQTERLADGKGWTIAQPLPQFDPDYVNSPIFSADQRTDGYIPYGKHPAYPILLVPFYAVAGAGGVLFASVVGAVLAALATGAIAERLRPGSRVVAFWVAALGSPLFFDGLIVEAHALAAAAVGGMVLATLAYRRQPRLLAAAGSAAAATVATLLRTEAVLLVLAFAVAIVVVERRERRTAVFALSAAIAGVAVLVRLGEPRGVRVLLPGSPIALGGHLPGAPSAIGQRIAAAYTVLLEGGYGTISMPYVLSVLAAVLVVATALVVRRKPGDEQGIVLFSAVTAAVFVIRAVVAPSGAIPALPLVCPVLVFGLALARRSLLSDRTVQLLTVTVVLFGLGVLATQYGLAGAREWGWRYVAIALPLVVPLAVHASWDAVAGLASRARTAVLAMLVVASLALVAVGVGTLVSDHRTSADQAAMTLRAIDSGVAGAPPDTVVLTTYPPIGRYLWRDIDHVRMAIVYQGDLRTVLPELPAKGIDRMLLVTEDRDRDLPAMRAAFGTVQELDRRAGVSVFLLTDPRR